MTKVRQALRDGLDRLRDVVSMNRSCLDECVTQNKRAAEGLLKAVEDLEGLVESTSKPKPTAPPGVVGGAR